MSFPLSRPHWNVNDPARAVRVSGAVDPESVGTHSLRVNLAGLDNTVNQQFWAADLDNFLAVATDQQSMEVWVQGDMPSPLMVGGGVVARAIWGSGGIVSGYALMAIFNEASSELQVTLARFNGGVVDAVVASAAIPVTVPEVTGPVKLELRAWDAVGVRLVARYAIGNGPLRVFYDSEDVSVGNLNGQVGSWGLTAFDPVAQVTPAGTGILFDAASAADLGAIPPPVVLATFPDADWEQENGAWWIESSGNPDPWTTPGQLTLPLDGKAAGDGYTYYPLSWSPAVYFDARVRFSGARPSGATVTALVGRAAGAVLDGYIAAIINSGTAALAVARYNAGAPTILGYYAVPANTTGLWIKVFDDSGSTRVRVWTSTSLSWPMTWSLQHDAVDGAPNLNIGYLGFAGTVDGGSPSPGGAGDLVTFFRFDGSLDGSLT